ncbi:3-hydroxy-2-methylbutyryl-CoA dehydrogenase [Sphingobium chlorophenolicum L-1]|uniref:3-hydroxy-2-methylbutyryl-CoA dehydrogenase n=1 Tax=Sphingobium chlorophenolicum L-1 TaxID=690566 RepID=F6F342_SPHCR|nr:SDR family NAD(P)-dependent oxidoreductase [Sphingobium chlorophenolicum]AEG50854.1 3-hydroxy-2-methylbutyryl-CoA dehydrogenase [Sphingobium chlorophenolicum L-1]
MNIEGAVALVTGAASGLGRATAERLIEKGAKVLIVDLSVEAGAATAAELGPQATSFAGDVADEAAMRAAFEAAAALGSLRAVVHCAGRGGPLRVLDRDGNAGALETYEAIIRTNLVGSFNVLRLGAEAMARQEPVDGERGVVVMTASVAAYEGQIGQIPYASSKAGVVGMTIVAARDLAARLIRVCTIAPGLFDTPLLARVSEDVRKGLAASVPHPSRLGTGAEFAMLAEHIIANPMLNGETIRLDGALRMQPR